MKQENYVNKRRSSEPRVGIGFAVIGIIIQVLLAAWIYTAGRPGVYSPVYGGLLVLGLVVPGVIYLAQAIWRRSTNIVAGFIGGLLLIGVALETPFDFRYTIITSIVVMMVWNIIVLISLALYMSKRGCER